jgi:hypothetical protein
MTTPHPRPHRQCMPDLVIPGQWGLLTGSGWLMRGVHSARAQEGLQHASR